MSKIQQDIENTSMVSSLPTETGVISRSVMWRISKFITSGSWISHLGWHSQYQYLSTTSSASSIISKPNKIALVRFCQ